MEFEFDAAKSDANRRKHGIGFTDAQALWSDHNRVEVPARTENEPRWLVIGRVYESVYSAVITYRDHRVRLISVRRARTEEVGIYEG